MASHLRWGRLIRIACIAILAPIVCLFAVVRIQQYVLRWRAERLLADIREIQMGKSTWADAQRLMAKWGAWGWYENSCTSAHCDYQVAIEDASQSMPTLSFPSITMRHTGRLIDAKTNRVYRILGGHFAEVAARIQVKNGVVWAKSFEADIMIQPLFPNPDIGEPIVLDADAVGATQMAGFPRVLPETPEFGGDLGSKSDCCRTAFVKFTPRADPHLVDALLTFNLSCITRWIECETTEELAPDLTGTVKELEKSRERFVDPGDVDAFPLDVLARECHYAAVAVAIGPASLKAHMTAEYMSEPSFRILESLKNHAAFNPPILHDRQVQQIWVPRPSDGEPHVVPPGTKVILLFDISPDDTDRAGGMEVVVPFNDSNLAQVKRGIALDGLADVP